MSGHSDDPDWRREHAVDHADYLDALLDPDDPLHAVAVKAQGSGDSELVGIARTLLIKEPWASLILDGKMTWELRRSQTEVRGVVGITPSGSGQVAGQAELVDVRGPFSPEELRPYRNKHQVDDAFAGPTTRAMACTPGSFAMPTGTTRPFPTTTRKVR